MEYTSHGRCSSALRRSCAPSVCTHVAMPTVTHLNGQLHSSHGSGGGHLQSDSLKYTQKNMHISVSTQLSHAKNVQQSSAWGCTGRADHPPGPAGQQAAAAPAVTRTRVTAGRHELAPRPLPCTATASQPGLALQLLKTTYLTSQSLHKDLHGWSMNSEFYMRPFFTKKKCHKCKQHERQTTNIQFWRAHEHPASIIGVHIATHKALAPG